MSGPQAERDARWLRDEDDDEGPMRSLGAKDIEELLGVGATDNRGLDAELQAVSGVRAEVDPTSHGQSYLEDEVQRVRGENTHLRQLAARLQNELGRWVRKYQEPPAPQEDADDEESPGALSPWITTPHVYSPLLMAYDARLNELRGAAKAAERQLAEDREHIARLNQENDRLQADLDAELKNRVRELESGHEPASGAGAGGGSGQDIGVVTNETITMLNGLVDTLQKENSILQERDTILNRDVERMAEQGKERDHQLVKITDNFQAATAGLRAAKEQIDELRRERSAALSQLGSLTGQLNELGTEHDRVVATLQDRERDYSFAQTQLTKLRHELEDLASKANAETELQEQRVASANKQSRHVRRALEAAQQELEALRAKHQELNVRHESTKHNCDNLSATVQSLKLEIHELRAREDAIRALEERVKQHAEDMKLERDQAVAVATQKKAEVDRLLEQRTITAKEAVRAREAAVRETQAQLQSKLRARGVELEECERKCVRIALEAERAKQDQFEATSRLESLRKAAAEEGKRLEAAMSKLAGRVETAEAKAIEREAEAQRALQECAAREAQADQERAASQEQQQAMRQQLQAANMRVESAQNELKRLEAEAESANKDAARVRQELANLRLASEARIENAEQRARLKQQQLQVRTSQAEAKAEELEQELENLRQVADRAKAHHLDELSSTVAHFERLVAEQKEEIGRLRARCEELGAQILSLQHAKAEADGLVKRQAAQLRKLDSSLHATEKRASEAREQVAELLNSEERRVREQSEVRRKLDQAEIDRNRAVRERDAALASLEERNQARHLFTESYSPPRRLKTAPASPSSRSARLRLETIERP